MDTSDSSMETSNGTGTGTGPGTGTGTGPSTAIGAAVPGTVPGDSTIVASAASLTLVKAEVPEHLAGTSTTPSAVTGPVGTGSGLFAGIPSSNKTSRPDDWLATGSPGSPQATLQSHHVVYTTPQQQLPDPQPPLAHSSPLAHQQQQPPASNNGYASPMSTSSYDPYSPNSKIGSPGTSRVVLVSLWP
ncbi:period circadian protein-like isoform X4 [Vespa crabro]|uniref:period circadian protein-like isoform X4 n=1 Tax=Vespa crabro TaxID=7445 RepID=UPI001F00C167|nr:period circadian protein-like isoform X4 [Vespa crabro]